MLAAVSGEETEDFRDQIQKQYILVLVNFVHEHYK